MPNQKDVTGLLLAGGHSTRFGSDKAQHEIDGQTMLAHVYDAVSAVVDEVLVSVGDESIRPLEGVACVVDRVPDAGPLAGLHAGLHAIQTPWMLAVACDMPFLTAEALRTLLAARAPEVDAVVARSGDGRLHPLCACYHRRTLAVVDAHLGAGRLALHALLDALKTVRVVDLPSAALRNVNRPSDVDTLKRKA